MRYLDTHAHLNLAQFDTDRAAVAATCVEKGVGMINVGTHQATSQLAVELAENNQHMWAMVGLHPINVLSPDPDDPKPLVESVFDYDYYLTLAQHERVVGVGECGFDFFHNPDDSYEQQREVFEAQIALANEVEKPLMLHLRSGQAAGGRDAYDDALEILRATAAVPGNAHFWAGSIDQMRQFFDLGYTVSFTGVITFALMYRELVEYAPLDMMHAETDCPYVAPVPHRGSRCEPWMVEEVVRYIAEIKQLPLEEVSQQLRQNATRLYGIEF